MCFLFLPQDGARRLRLSCMKTEFPDRFADRRTHSQTNTQMGMQLDASFRDVDSDKEFE